MPSTPSIAVIGSLNIDFITRTPRVPGETLTSNSFSTGFGGKGANQAVACARLASKGTKVAMVGNVGDDGFGKDYFEALGKEGIDSKGVKTVEGETTGAANILVEEETGENRIMFTPGANVAFSKTYDQGWDLVPGDAGVVVCQLEIPIEVVSFVFSVLVLFHTARSNCGLRSASIHANTKDQVLHNLHLACQQGKHTMFNPAPALPLPESSYKDIDTLIMNESEANILSGTSPDEKAADLTPLLSHFLQLGVRDAVIITLGGAGVMYATASGKQGKVAAKKVKVVDTTAAGDTFLGAYAAKRVQHMESDGEFGYEAALEFATMAAGKTVEKKGAMAAIPTLAELN
jgi:ribokinase